MARKARATGSARDRGSARDSDEPFNLMDLDPPEDDDTTVAGHLVLRQQRQLLHYMRLIEHEMPNLVAFRKPFTAPTSSTPLVVRSLSYAGEDHPATSKRVIVTPVAHLPLKNDIARHNLKLIAGVRWTQTPPKGSGIGHDEDGREHGYIKIACEDFPRPAMNLKWASDALDRLVKEANNAGETFKDIPVDSRHVDARARKEMKGGHKRLGHRPSIKDFPRDWLPDQPLAVDQDMKLES